MGHTAWAPEGREGRYQAGPKGRSQEVGARRAPRLLGYDAYSYWHTVPANFVSTLSDDPSNDIKPIPDLECQDIWMETSSGSFASPGVKIRQTLPYGAPYKHQ